MRLSRSLSFAGLAVFLGFAIVYPFGSLFLTQQLAFSSLFDSYVLHVVKLTLQTSVIALVLSAALALPLSLTLFHSKHPVAKLICIAFEVLWVFPSFLFVLATLYLLKAFDVESLYSMRSVLLGWVLISIPFLTIQFMNGLRDLDPREREALRTLGAGTLQEILFYDFPKLRAVVSNAVLHQFCLYFTSFTLVVLLNGGPPNETLEVAVYHAIRLDRVDWNSALALALWQIFILVLVRFTLRFGFGFWSGRKTEQVDAVGWEWFQLSRVSVLRRIATGLAVLDLGFLLLTAPSDLQDAALWGAALSATVALLTLLYCMGAYFFRLAWLAELGGWFSPIVFAVAWWKSYRFSLPPLLICALIQMILFAPWLSRTLFPLLKRERRFEREAIQTLGASPFKTWFLVEWPRLKSTIFWLTALVFSLSLSEVSTVILFSTHDFLPLSVWIQNSLSRFHLSEAWQGTVLLLLLASTCILGLRSDHE